MDYIENPSDLMNLGKDTGRLDGNMSGSSSGGGKEDEEGDEKDEDDEKKNGKRLRMSLQKGEVTILCSDSMNDN